MKEQKTIHCPRCEGAGKVENPKWVGEQAQKRREKANVTLREVSEITGYSISYWSDLEHGRKAWNDRLKSLYDDAVQELSMKKD